MPKDDVGAQPESVMGALGQGIDGGTTAELLGGCSG